MNERIKELANQLGPVATIGNWGRVEWADNVYPQLGDKMYAAIDLEKFAQLIVAECGHLMVDIMLHGGVEPEAGYDIMMKHFGVEE